MELIIDFYIYEVYNYVCKLYSTGSVIMFKILAIGNSFSQDATAYLKQISAAGGKDMFVQNMYIGGCSLERHINELKAESKAYSLEINGQSVRPAILSEEIKAYDWDVVTVQQVSHCSGQWETYEPYITELVDFIRKHKPNAKIYFHKTWAYEYDSKHAGFAKYDNDQKKMHDCITECSKKAAELIKADGIIPSGDVINELRKLPEFDTPNGGQTLCRDGFHMHYVYGRYATAATWYETLLGGDITTNPWLPFEKMGNVSQSALDKLEIIKQTVHKVVSEK